ncbi:MAG: glycerol-3-phosphate acyltransferase, partial [Brevundimonas sp.]
DSNVLVDAAEELRLLEYSQRLTRRARNLLAPGTGGSTGRGLLQGAVAGGAAFLGHLFPVWLKFKGGKGVATFYGLLLAAAWPLGLMAGAVWLISAFVFRYSSLAALISSATAPLLALLPLAAVGLPVAMPILCLTVFAAVLIWVRHHQNIARLLKGEEPRIGAKKA